MALILWKTLWKPSCSFREVIRTDRSVGFAPAVAVC